MLAPVYIMLEETRDDMTECRYPMWPENDHEEFRVCGAKIFLGAYCGAHALICYPPAEVERHARRKRSQEAEIHSGIKRAFG